MRFLKRLSLSLIIVLVVSHAPIRAQEGGADACPAIVDAALDVTAQACAGLSRNEACYGHVLLTATPRASGETLTFVAAGDRVEVDRLERLRLGPMNALEQTWGVAMLRLQANLPETLPGQAVTLVLFGDVEVANTVISVPRQNVTAVRGVNVRRQPSTSGQVISSLVAGDEVEASGRTEDGWLRITLAVGRIGWVSADFVSSAGDLAELAVIEDFAAEPTEFTPMQAFTLNTGFGAPGCAEAPGDGLLIQTPEDSPEAVALVVNGATIMLGSTIYLQAAPDDRLLVRTVEGYATVTAAGETEIAPAGTQISVPLDGLTVSGPPSEPEPYDSAAVAALPITLVEREITIAEPVPVEAIPEAALAAQPCTVTALSPTTQYEGPGEDFPSVRTLIQDGQTREPKAYTTSADGVTWWRVMANLWVPGDSVAAAASCAYLPFEEQIAPTAVPVVDLNSIAAAPTCIAAPFNTANLRNGPGTGYGFAGQLVAGQEIALTAYSQATDGYRWWRLDDNSWIRGDLVQVANVCLSLPEAQSTPEPPTVAAVGDGEASGRIPGDCSSFTFTSANAINVFACQNAGGYTIEAGCSYPIRMSVGFPNDGEAEARASVGSFSLPTTLDGAGLAAVSGNVVEYNAYAGFWEVNQYFATGVLSAGTYTVVGSTYRDGAYLDSATCMLFVR